jgi:dihydrofolate reductase
MRKFIAGMKLSLDGKFQGPDGYADWVDAWSDDYGVMPQIDACIVGGGMYPGYEHYWSVMQKSPGEPLPMTGQMPTPKELDWARFAAQTPHYVLSTSLTAAAWPKTVLLRSLEEVEALRKQPGKDIYVMGGGSIIASFIEAGLLDELRLITYPVIAGGEHTLLSGLKTRRTLALRSLQQLEGGKTYLAYGFEQIAAAA